MEGFDCRSFLKEELVGVKTGGALFGDRGPLPAERGRVTSRAAGGPFLVPLRMDLLARAVARAGTGGGSSDGCRLIEDAGALKAGLGNE